jgi:photosystem II stability/assembly factor-like uncharacterized protein
MISSDGVFAGTCCAGILYSADNGKTWATRNNGLPQYAYVTAITHVGSQLYIAAMGGIYASVDNGITWSSTGSDLSGKTILGLVAHGNDLFAAVADAGVFMSLNLGKTWTALNDGLPAKFIAYCVAVNGSWLYVGTNGEGVWRRSL